MQTQTFETDFPTFGSDDLSSMNTESSIGDLDSNSREALRAARKPKKVEKKVDPSKDFIKGHYSPANDYRYAESLREGVMLEKEMDKEETERVIIEAKDITVTIREDQSSSRTKVYVQMDVPSVVHCVPGNTIYLFNDRLQKTINAHVRSNFNDTYEVKIAREDIREMREDDDYKATFSWNGTAFDRMLSAIKTLQTEYPKDTAIYETIHGRRVSDDLRLTGHNVRQGFGQIPSVTLNSSQMMALRTAVSNHFSVVQGPPGTGKTTVCSAIVYEMKQILGDEMILVCAQSNQGIDNLTERISRTGLNIVRVVSGYKESEDRMCQEQCLHVRMLNDDLGLDEEQARYASFKREIDGGLLGRVSQYRVEEILEEFRALEETLISAVLDKADVLATTCVGSVDRRILDRFSYGFMLMDEASQCSQPEILIPLMNGITHCCLVGDTKQLGPVMKDKGAERIGLSVSMYERIEANVRGKMLLTQYRMHPSISEFSNKTFYRDRLENGISDSDRPLPGCLDPLFPANQRSIFINVNCQEEEDYELESRSIVNRGEVEEVVDTAGFMVSKGIKQSQIAIITPYQGQKRELIKDLILCDLKEIEVGTIDSFQGREFDYILMSLVRSNEEQRIGFLYEPRRLNVSVTRARFGQIVFGNVYTLSSNRNLREFIKQNRYSKWVKVEKSEMAPRKSKKKMTKKELKRKALRRAIT